MKDQKNSDETSTYLQYLDANSLYGWVLIQNLRTHGFMWKNFNDFTLENKDKLVKKDR